ncbi:hypothetical protein [Streptomyces sp. RLB1-9]|uniref:hypothetical protein n=1 Tax=Streptomyces sp. RLB1-9 TaxID=2594454 RepID=UPI0013DD5502|nr:hypothetical protein [Streptomyces sp. RLB1-9]
MDVKVLNFDLTAARPEFPGKDFGESACTVTSAGSLAYCELLLSMSVAVSDAVTT